MNIIILGAGRVGESVAESLVSEQNDITVIDQDPARLRLLEERLDLRGVVGNGIQPSVLRVTGGERWKPMIQRLASNLGFGEHLRHIETVTPSGSELQANPEMAIQCLGEACRRAAKDGVRVIILGGAGLAGYAEKLQPICPLPLIDSARAGIEVLLNHQAPRAKNFLNGSYAKWSGMSGSLSQVKEFD